MIAGMAIVCEAIASPIYANNVLLTSSGNATQDAALVSLLESYGHSVALGPQYSSFTGGGLAGADTVLLQTNYNWTAGDMPTNGQTALLDYVGNGGGLITTEWFVWKAAANNHFNQLMEAIPVAPNTTFRSAVSVSYSQVTPDPILNSGLANNFSFNPGSISGSETFLTALPEATVFYESDYSFGGDLGAGLVGWTYGSGRVLTFSTLLAGVSLDDSNYGRLIHNSVVWTSVPEPSAFMLAVISTFSLVVPRWRRAV